MSGTTVAKKLGKEVIQVGTMHSSIHDERMFEYFTTANVASWADRQADLVAWDPESNTPIMIEYKRYSSTAVRFSLAHELGHLELTDGHIRQTYSTAEPRHAKQVVYERKLAKVLAAFPDVRRLIGVRSDACHAHQAGADHFAEAVITGTAVARFADRRNAPRPPSLAVLPLDACGAPDSPSWPRTPPR